MTLKGTTSRGLVAAALVLLVSCSTPGGPSSEVSPSAAATEAGSPALPPPPATTPPGTPAPIPDVALATSMSVQTPEPAPQATPTATPQPGLWRIQGYVVNEDQQPLHGVCVVVGPRGCQRYSPHTDERGHWFLDIAEGGATFDFYFEMPGYQTVWLHVHPEGPTEYNVILKRG